MKVFLVHGIFDDGRLFNSMRQYFNRFGIITLVPALKPADARYGIEDLAHKLSAFISENIEKGEQFSIIGFSMGCIISRVYLQTLGGAAYCINFHAISGPHHGSILAYFFFGQGAKDLRPNSALLQRLQRTQNILSHINIFSYRTPFDQMILPSKSSHWSIAKNLVVKAPMHRLMLNNKFVWHSIKNNLILKG